MSLTPKFDKNRFRKGKDNPYFWGSFINNIQYYGLWFFQSFESKLKQQFGLVSFPITNSEKSMFFPSKTKKSRKMAGSSQEEDKNEIKQSTTLKNLKIKLFRLPRDRKHKWRYPHLDTICWAIWTKRTIIIVKLELFIFENWEPNC